VLLILAIISMSFTKLPLPRITVKRAKRLRQTMTETEQLLWYHLRSNRMGGAKFRRQHPIPPYIVDFCCIEQKLVIELDGSQHTTEVDAQRTRALEARGWRVVRYWNHEVLTQTEAVLSDIWMRVNTERFPREPTDT